MDKRILIILSHIRTISVERVQFLRKQFKGVMSSLLNLPVKELAIMGFKPQEIKKLKELLESREIENEERIIEERGVHLIDFFSDEYPPLLREIPFAPLVLYVEGDKRILKTLCFAIVGARLATLYGITMAEKFAYQLASSGITIVSGLAQGIDTAAHKGALKTGRTIAVLGSGLADIYPRQNTLLAEKIKEKGALITEFPFNMPPLKGNFPQRNRIISGLSKGVLVVEAGNRSGALITANYALEQNREVFALPGKVDSLVSRGTHLLIKEGAKLVDCVEDIWEELNLKPQKVERLSLLSKEEKDILEVISSEGTFIDEVISKSGLPRRVIDRAIFKLQVRGLIQESKPLCFVKSNYV